MIAPTGETSREIGKAVAIAALSALVTGLVQLGLDAVRKRIWPPDDTGKA